MTVKKETKKIRSRMSPPPRNPQTITGDSMTQQHFLEEADINTIVRRYMKTGIMANARNPVAGAFGDFTPTDYQEMRNQIADIDQNFSSLPAKVRRRFDDDPYQLLRWLDRPENIPEAIKMGLVPDPDPKPAKAPSGASQGFQDESQLDIEIESKKPVTKPAQTPPKGGLSTTPP